MIHHRHKPKTLLELHSRAFALLASKSTWTQGAEARTKDGVPTSFDSPRAVAWDSWGAVHRALKDFPSRMQEELGTKLLGALSASLPYSSESLSTYNDRAEYEDVLALWALATPRSSL